MTDPIEERFSFAAPLQQVLRHSRQYLAQVDELPVSVGPRRPHEEIRERLLPIDGIGAEAATLELVRLFESLATNTTGPRFLNFVTGGVTSAALAADWLTSLYDQNSAGKVTSDFGTELERLVISWLRSLIGVPPEGSGVLVPSATYANFTGLGCAREWWTAHYGVSAAQCGLSGLPRIRVLGGGYVHPSVRKALLMLGLGQDCVEVFSRDKYGKMDFRELRAAVNETKDPVIIVASAGEVNAGDFDPLNDIAELASSSSKVWLHIDGAFGAFARLSPRTAELCNGIEYADSIAGDCHKWLNVPYDSGFCLVKEKSWLSQAFPMPGANYISDLAAEDAGYAAFGPDASRRTRAATIYATVRAYGASGYRTMAERQLDAALRLARHLDGSAEFELLAPVKLPIVCFRAAPVVSTSDATLDKINRALLCRFDSENRFSVGSTVYGGKQALRVSLLNWRITDQIIDELCSLLDLHVAAIREDTDEER